MKRPNDNKDRESRIIDEIVVDAYGEQERAMGWYYYAADKITFPFKACYATKRASSPLINIGNHPPSSRYVLAMLGIPRRQQALLAEYPHHQATNHNSSANTRFPRPVRSDAGQDCHANSRVDRMSNVAIRSPSNQAALGRIRGNMITAATKGYSRPNPE